MNYSNKITIKEYSDSAFSRARFKVFLISFLIISPLYLTVLFYLEHQSIVHALIPATKQISQNISTGDEVSLDRIVKSLTLLPQVSSAYILLNDGTCLTTTQMDPSLITKQLKNCAGSSDLFTYKIENQISTPQLLPLGTLVVWIFMPWRYILFLPLIIFLSVTIVYLVFRSRFTNVINKISSITQKFSLIFDNQHDTDFEFVEFQKAYIHLVKIKEKEMAIAAAENYRLTANQVSHDIRSPLAALEMMSESLNELPEEKRLIIRNSINRIRDISHSLLKKERNSIENKDTPTSDNLVEPFSNTLLSTLVDSIIAEKRIQYRNQMNMRIDFRQRNGTYGLFANIRQNEFQRVLSNLIDNSKESFVETLGAIEIFLHLNLPDRINLLIKDNGKGIPQHILPKLGVRGETHGKENGSGLGLFHAKETIESSNGTLKIESEVGKGTVVTITLPLQSPPAWFVPKISLKPGQTLIAFDDDQSIHQIWKGRLESISNHETVNLLHFSDPSEMRKFYGKNFTDLDEALFLMDYEISGTTESGLDVIETLGIQKQSILVTSRYEEKSIRERCESLGVRLIPKNMSGFVPMEIVS